MQVTKLRLSGFKSFGHPTDLLIEPGLTGIVGPNGCGKSNLIDALRWVMGEASVKGLRGGEMDDVIFAGTAARPPFDLAEVELHLRGAALSVPGLGEVDEFQLARRIGRGAGSVFRVNGREVRARDVQVLFADAASGARSAAIVTQGQIGALVDAKPAERRRLLEEAAGIGGLQARRHEAELKLQAAEANLLRVQDLVVTLGEQHRHLRKQAREAKRYREVSAAHREAEAILLVCRWQVACSELAAAEAILRDGRSAIALRSERLTKARGERDRAAAEFDRLRQRDAALAAELARLGERRGVLSDEVARLEADRTRLRELDAQLERDLGDGERALEDAQGARAQLEAERGGLGEVNTAARRRCERAAAAETAATAMLERAETELRRALAVQAELDARLRQLTEGIGQAAEARRALTEAAEKTDRALAALAATAPPEGDPASGPVEAEVHGAEAALRSAEAALDQVEREREASQSAAEAATAQLASDRDRLRTAEEAERHARQQREALEVRRQDLEQRRGRLCARLVELTATQEDRARRRAGLDLAARNGALEVAQHEVDDADGALEAARHRAGEAEVALADAQQAEQSVRGALQRLEAEIKALADLSGPEPAGTPMIDLIEVAQSDARALAAALGDDLLAGLDPAAPSHWREDLEDASQVQALPPGCRALADVVRAPPALQRRLAQVGLVDADQAARLQPDLRQGQRLVSRDGGLWRWDGFVRRPDAGRGAAARLQQRARLLELQRDAAAARSELVRAERTTAEAREAVATARAEQRRAETCAEAARRQVEVARAAVLEVRADDAGLAAELSALAQERATIEAEQRELESTAAMLDRQLQELVGVEAAPDIARLREAARQAEAARDECLRRERQAKDAQAEAQDTLSAARDRLARARAELDRRRDDERERAAEVRRQELERVQLEARRARLADERADLDRQQASTERSLSETEDEQRAAQVKLTEAERVVTDVRQGHAEACMEHARARDALAVAEGRATALASELELWTERARAGEAKLADLGRRRADLARDLTALDEAPGKLERQRAEFEARLAEVEHGRRELDQAVRAAETALAEAQTSLDSAETERVEARENGARFEARLERAQAEHAEAEAALRARFGQLPEMPEEELPSAGRLAELEAELTRLSAARERLGPVNLRAIDEAEELALRIQDLEAEQAELAAAIERLRRAISTLNREGRERLRAAFAKVEEHFEALFVRLFGGGRARLSLTDLEDPLAAGLELAASPPGKKLQSISLLSGGEKALTALALIFAVFLTRPSPLCVLDEVDAPLDDANVERLLALLDELTSATDTRFMIITHNPLTMARMHRLYGVTMAERGLSHLVSVDLQGAVELRATA